jgi:5,10-methylenetetrahydromethanopterin reductase
MRFSLRVNNDLPAGRLVELAQAAERAGFDQLWVSNDLFLRSAPVLVGLLAARTSTLRLGIAVMNPYSVHLSELAMMAATAQEVSRGRFLLGIGAGSAQFLGWAGITQDAPLRRTQECVAGLRQLLGHRDVDPGLLPGWLDTTGPAGSRLKVPVAEPVPVYVGAMGPQMLAMAGRCSDGALPLLYPPEHYPVAREQVLRGRAEAGRETIPFDLPACFWVSVATDRAAGRAALAQKLAYYGPSISPDLLARVGLTPADFAPAAELAQQGRPAGPLVDDRMLSLGISGTVADVLARCAELVVQGAAHLSFGPPLGPDPVQAVAVLGAQVIPALRDQGPG